MIVVDGSALLAILLGEPREPKCRVVIEREEDILMSAGSLAELLIVALGKGVSNEMANFLDAIHPTIMPLTAARAHAAADAYRRWGKGFHPAGLNMGDSFAYALAIEHHCALLFVGNDFGKTDVIRAIA